MENPTSSLSFYLFVFLPGLGQLVRIFVIEFPIIISKSFSQLYNYHRSIRLVSLPTLPHFTAVRRFARRSKSR